MTRIQDGLDVVRVLVVFDHDRSAFGGRSGPMPSIVVESNQSKIGQTVCIIVADRLSILSMICCNRWASQQAIPQLQNNHPRRQLETTHTPGQPPPHTDGSLGWVHKEVTETYMYGYLYYTSSIMMKPAGIEGISMTQSRTTAADLAGRLLNSTHSSFRSPSDLCLRAGRASTPQAIRRESGSWSRRKKSRSG